MEKFNYDEELHRILDQSKILCKIKEIVGDVHNIEHPHFYGATINGFEIHIDMFQVYVDDNYCEEKDIIELYNLFKTPDNIKTVGIIGDEYDANGDTNLDQEYYTIDMHSCKKETKNCIINLFSQAFKQIA